MPLDPNVSKKPLEVKVASTKLQSRRLAQRLSDVITFIQATAITRDFFEGYSLSEAIQERLDLIGGDGQEFTQGQRGIKTLLAELDQLETDGLQAIEAAREAKAIEESTDEDAAIDPVQVDNEDVFIVEA